MAFVGLDTFLAYSATAGATPVAIGRIESAELDPDQSLEHITGAGGESEPVYSMIEPTGSCSMWLQNDTILAHLQKTVVNGLPPVIGALDGGAAGGTIKRHTDCYITTWEMNLEKDGAVKLDFDWKALTHTTSSQTAAPAGLGKRLLFVWHQAAVTLGSQAFECQSIRLRGDNAPKLATDLDAKAEGVERQPKVTKPGNSKVTVEVDFASYPTVELVETNPATVALAFSCKNTAATVQTLLATVDNIHPVKTPVVIASGEDEVVYRFSGELDWNDLTSLTMGILP